MAQMTLPDWFREARPGQCPDKGGRAGRRGFVEKNLAGFASALARALSLDEYASRKGALQALEPRARLAGLIMLAVAAAVTGSAAFLAAMVLLSTALSALSRVGVGPLARRALPPLAFTTALALPVALSAVTPGTEVAGAFGVAITAEGLSAAGFFVLRVAAIVSAAALLALTTRHSDLYSGFGVLPGFFAAALFLTFRYALILIKAAEDSTLARKSRTIERARLGEAQRWFASRAAHILKKSFGMAEEVNMAMISRGFTGRLVMASASARLKGRDYLWLGFAVFVIFLSFGF